MPGWPSLVRRGTANPMILRITRVQIPSPTLTFFLFLLFSIDLNIAKIKLGNNFQIVNIKNSFFRSEAFKTKVLNAQKSLIFGSEDFFDQSLQNLRFCGPENQRFLPAFFSEKSPRKLRFLDVQKTKFFAVAKFHFANTKNS